MNRPCRIHFHEDAAPFLSELPERYRKNVEELDATAGRVVRSLLVQNAFPIDYAPAIIRTRVGGTKEEDPVDFPLASILFIEWFYGSNVPFPLRPWERPERERSTRGVLEA